MREGDMFESEVITFVAPKKSGWLNKKGKGQLVYEGTRQHGGKCLVYPCGELGTGCRFLVVVH